MWTHSPHLRKESHLTQDVYVQSLGSVTVYPEKTGLWKAGLRLGEFPPSQKGDLSMKNNQRLVEFFRD